MYKIQRSLLFVALLTLPFYVACSSSHSTKADESNAGDQSLPLEESGADAVGSTPEDKLLAEEAKDTAAAPAADGAAAATTPTDSADPFADLQASNAKAEVAKSESTEAPSAASGAMQSYTVKKGDTLMKIAFSIYGDLDRWKDLSEWNKDKLKNANKLAAGMSLTYEAPSVAFTADQLSHNYTIKKGDTLAKIADEVYGRKQKYKKLQNYNAHLIKNPNRIFAGFTLFYDITDQEVAEAEARRQERATRTAATPSAAPAVVVPSAVTGTGVTPAAAPAVAAQTTAPASTAPAAVTPAPAAEAAAPKK